MSWMDDGGFDMQAFTAQDGRPMARMRANPQGNGGRQMTNHDSKPEATKPNYTLRRLKFAAAVIGFVSSVTLLFTWHVTDRRMAWLVAGIYILTGLWLTVRFAPRD